MRKLPIIVLTSLFPTAVFAHPGTSDTVGFIHGFAHPLSGIDHILAMLAVGVLACVLGGRALWLVPLSFVLMMVVGFLLGAGGLDLPFVELGIALSSLAIGGAAAIGRPMRVAAAMALVGVFAVFHGHAHGIEMPENAGGLLYALGFVLAAASLHAAGIAGALGMGTLVDKHYGAIATRATGGLFALGGIGVLFGWH
jgi:urease accessory protein